MIEAAGSFDPRAFHRIVVLTGAGVSRASGLATFRGQDGVVTTGKAKNVERSDFERDPGWVWQQYMARRRAILEAAPNAAHHALAGFERSSSGKRELLLITQNVDGLHRAAGSENLIEIHGNLMRYRCDDRDCDHPPPDDDGIDFDAPLPPRCECGSYIRPDIVMFGETLDIDDLLRIREALERADLFVAIGTSGVVTPVSRFAWIARDHGATTALINAEAPSGPHAFDVVVEGRAEEAVPSLFGPA